MLVVNELARGGVALGPHELVAGQREAHVAGGHIVDVALIVREDGNLGLEDIVAIGVAAEDAFDFPLSNQREDRGEILGAVTFRRGDRDADGGVLGHDETEIVALEIAAAIDGRGGLAVVVAALDADAIRDVRGGDEVALVATIDEDFSLDGVQRAAGVAKARGAHDTIAGGTAGGGVDERPRGLHRDLRVLGEHLLKQEENHLRLGVRAAEGVFHLRRIFAVGFGVVGERALREIVVGAGDGLEGAEIRMLEAVGRHAADADRRLG